MAQSLSYNPTLDPTIFGFPDPFGKFMIMYGSLGMFPDATVSRLHTPTPETCNIPHNNGNN
ncbi:hypothetical protein DFH07DRAFT_953564 [Mycena maculata]|uniref:Uncharacterized protein n=1 Tax=Mycena maculata TaxID=230809 RepID=A0AAD7NQN5_9AGAR|nr:hypothetical protein DFH07DRAFT_953564 [Mycena maculata]